MTREEFEAALDAGVLETREEWLNSENKYRWYRVRRNGQTRVWKRDPARFSIPVKYKLRTCMRVNEENFVAGTVDRWFRIASEPENGHHLMPKAKRPSNAPPSNT